MSDQNEAGELLDSILGNLRTDGVDEADASMEVRVLDAYRTEVDPRLVEAGWGFEAAKSVEFGKIDQSLLNHVRNGVFLLAQLNLAAERLGGYTLDEDDLRAAIALFTIHDIHKLDVERDADPHTRFDIPREEVDDYVERFGLNEFAPSLDTMDFRSCTVDHHDDWTANHERSTILFDDLRPFVRLADAFASSETPEAATRDSVQQSLDHAYPNEDFELRRHVLDDVKGILTNLVNGAIADHLGEIDYQRLAIYQDGCVYLVPSDAPRPTPDESFGAEVLKKLQQNIRSSHAAYQDPSELAGNLSTRSQGFYGINDQDFFNAGAETVLAAIAQRAVGDADPDTEPTESMVDAMSALEEHLPIEIERTRRPVGLARLAYTVRRALVDPVLEASDRDVSSLDATCEVFDVPSAVQDGLATAATDDDLSLTAGGKWDFAYGIGQALLDERLTEPADIAQQLRRGLATFDDDWNETIEQEHAGNLQSELRAYLSDVISIDGRPLPQTRRLSDSFDEYHGARRGKTCVLCNRGTTSTTKSDIEAPKSLTTLQAGYSNHVPVDAGKPDELLACIPCQIELSLRETGASRREGGRLFVHLVPDYFYTPLSWRSYSSIMEGFSGESRVELGRLAESVLWLTGDLDNTEGAGFDSALFDPESGRSMTEALDQGFDPGVQYGARTLGYFKPKDNDTEFQFFGVFVALAIAAYAGLRVYVSESPIPDVRGRDFSTYARIGGGFTQVHDFYGTEVPLSELQSRLRRAAALVRLGYGSDRNDALFAKFLRVTRNQILPGSHLLKRIAQADDSRDARYLLEDARVLDEEAGISKTTDVTPTTNK